MKIVNWVSTYEVLHALETAEVHDIICPNCGRMTRVEPLTDKDWLCYECHTCFCTESEDDKQCES